MTPFEQQLIQGQQHLIDNDKKLASVINKVGQCRFQLRQDYFQSLVGSIISQQLSTKATSTIRGRLIELAGNDLSPDQLQQFNIEELRSVGLSKNKADFILRLAEHYDPDQFENLHKMEDEEVIKFLISFKGIGEWTAQMFLIFSLGRLDVLPIKDVGVQNGVKKIYSIDSLTDAHLIEIAESWRPYRSIAAWYSWRVLDALITI